MLIDFERQAEAIPRSSDIIVVGAGAVGLSVGMDLASRGRKVLLVEAGGARVEKASQDIFASATWTGFPLEGLHLGRFRALGGTTNFWSGQLVPFDPIVFQPRPWIADGGWPIARSDLDPFYARAFDLLGLGRRVEADEAIWSRLGVQPPATDEDLSLFFTRWAPEANLARLFKQRLASDPNVTALLNAPVRALRVAEGQPAVVDGIILRDPSGRDVSIGAKTTILANGTVEIARLLLSPPSGGGAAPWSSNAWLGRGFVDHVDAYAGDVKLLDPNRFHALFDSGFIDGLKYNPKLKLSEAAQRRDGLLGIAAHFIFKSRLGEDLAAMKVFARGLLKGQLDGSILAAGKRLVPTLRIAAPMIARYLRYRRTYNPTDAGVQLRLTCEQRPVVASGIRLRASQDRIGMPEVEMTWNIDGSEIDTMARFADLVAQFLAEAGLALVEVNPRLAARDRAFLQEIDDANHHMGMVRMGSSSREGVVDPDLRVFGAENLYVAGAAVFPTTGFANPTLTAIALGLRLSDHLGRPPAG